jgi:adenylate kinase family enzyme
VLYKLLLDVVVVNFLSWILDGYPNTEKQALLLDKFGVNPHIMAHVCISKSESMVRAQKEHEESQQ